jgi:hypothetical protein
MVTNVFPPSTWWLALFYPFQVRGLRCPTWGTAAAVKCGTMAYLFMAASVIWNVNFPSSGWKFETSLVYKVLQASQGRPDCICLGLVWLCLYLFIWSQILTLRGNPKDYSLLSRHFLSVTGKGLPSLSLVFHLLSHASLSPIPSEGSLLKTLLIPRETPTKSYPV